VVSAIGAFMKQSKTNSQGRRSWKGSISKIQSEWCGRRNPGAVRYLHGQNGAHQVSSHEPSRTCYSVDLGEGETRFLGR
jgi:hypothetical protein